MSKTFEELNNALLKAINKKGKIIKEIEEIKINMEIAKEKKILNVILLIMIFLYSNMKY